MSTPQEFAAECDRVSKALRHIPSDVRRELGHQVKDRVAAPLAAKIGAAATGPWAKILQPGTKARAAADPQIVVGGAFPKVSGGAGPRQVVFGTEFGGGGRRSVTHAHTRRGFKVSAYSRASTNQFAGHHSPFVFSTIEANLGEVLDTYADIVLTVMHQEVGGNA